MSDASHQAIKAWKKTWSRSPNAIIDPIEEFDRDIMSAPEETLQTGELRYLMHRKKDRHIPLMFKKDIYS
ncbi:MAG: hypothetical protein LBP69_02505 [Treponema sp.]|jgi:hypothetical protein|nr:hypothetical protein [Treponema sp.]